MDALSEKLFAIFKAGEETAQMNRHTTIAMVRNIYDTKNKARRNELVREVNNKFA